MESILNPTQINHAHLLFIGMMCSKFHLNDLKTVEGVLDTNIQ